MRLWKNRRLRRAQKRAARGDLTGAVAAFEAILDAEPDDIFARIHFALALADKGEYAVAAHEARDAVERSGGRPAVRLLAGRVFYDAENYRAARREFDAVLATNPQNDLARGYRVLADWADGDAEAWRRISPEHLPDSTPFLARWLARIEMEMRPMLRRAAEGSEAT